MKVSLNKKYMMFSVSNLHPTFNFIHLINLSQNIRLQILIEMKNLSLQYTKTHTLISYILAPLQF